MADVSDLCIPFVGGIIERTDNNGQKQFLIQTRNKPKFKSIYNGTLEFAAGVMDFAYESVYETLAREIKEETGMQLKKVIDDSRTEVVSPQGTDMAFGFRPFCCTQQLKEGRPWVGFVFRCEVEDGTPKDQIGESQNVHWMDEKAMYKIFSEAPQEIFALELPAWQYYFEQFRPTVS